MPVTIAKSKTKAEPKAAPKVELVEPSEMSDEDLADRYGSLEDQIQALTSNPLYAQFALVQEELKARMAKYDATDLIKIKGKHWLLDISACSKSPRKVTDNANVAKMLGNEVFMTIAKVTVGDAEKYLTPEQLQKVVSPESYTSNRKVSASFLG